MLLSATYTGHVLKFVKYSLLTSRMPINTACFIRFCCTELHFHTLLYRSNLQDDRVLPEYHSTHNDLHSPFVRTIYQNKSRPCQGLTRSWSSHHIGGNSVTVNVDWTHGRQVSRNILVNRKYFCVLSGQKLKAKTLYILA